MPVNMFDKVDFSNIPSLFINKSLKNSLDSSLNDSNHQMDIIEFQERSNHSDQNHTPGRSHPRHQLWDSGLGSPTPGSSPLKVTKMLDVYQTSRNSPALSPIPFHFEENLENSSNEMNNSSDLNVSCLPQTPLCRNNSFNSQRRIQFSSLKATSNKLQRSMKKMKLQASSPPQSTSFNKVQKPRNSFSKNSSKCKALFSSTPHTNINPFIPNKGKYPLKRSRDSNENEDHPHKKPTLRDMNTSRFREEFQVISKIGNGQFGSVYKCINRLDGCFYAIKRSKSPISGSANESSAVNEVYAHAVLGKHKHIVGYFSSWLEMDRIYIQTEYCNGGSLSDLLAQNKLENKYFEESQLQDLLLQLGEGTSYIHQHDLVHLDIKPDNVLVSFPTRTRLPYYKRKNSLTSCHDNNHIVDDNNNHIVPLDSLENLKPPSSSPSSLCTTIMNNSNTPRISLSSKQEEDEDCGFEEDSDSSPIKAFQQVIYKIGDFGMVTSVNKPQLNEGDCRYLPKEILQETAVDVQKADIFSLSLTVFEAGTNIEMPLNGPTWHEFRAVGLPDIKKISPPLNQLLKEMSHTIPSSRPSADEVVKRAGSLIGGQKSPRQLHLELEEQKKENQLLKKQLDSVIKKPSTTSSNINLGNGSHNNRLIGRLCLRSQSML